MTTPSVHATTTIVRRAATDQAAFIQAIFVQAAMTLPWGLRRNLPSLVLVQLSDGSLSTVATTGQSFDDNRVELAARAIQQAPAPRDFRSLDQRVADAVELPTVSVLPPTLSLFSAQDGRWGLRRFAVALLTSGSGSDVGSAALSRVVQELAIHLDAALADFKAGLDAAAWAIASAHPTRLGKIYNYVVHPQLQIALYRRQSAVACPLLLPGVAAPNGCPRLAAVRDAIDEGRPLVDAMAEAFGVMRSTARAIVGVPSEGVVEAWLRSPGDLLAVLDLLPSGDRPKGPESRMRVARFIRSVQPSLGERPSGSSSYFVRRRLAEVWSAPPDAEDAVRDMVNNASDAAAVDALWSVLVQLLTEVGQPGGRMGLGTQIEGVADRALTRLSLKRLVAVASQMPEAVSRERQRYGELEALWSSAGQKFWPLLAGGVLETVTRRVLSVTTPADLRALGDAVLNCLATPSHRARYESECRRGRYIVSFVERETGSPVSAAQLSLEQSADGRFLPRVEEHNGVRNTPRSAACRAAMQDLIQALAGDAGQRHLRLGQLAMKSANSHSSARQQLMVLQRDVQRRALQQLLGPRHLQLAVQEARTLAGVLPAPEIPAWLRITGASRGDA